MPQLLEPTQHTPCCPSPVQSHKHVCIARNCCSLCLCCSIQMPRVHCMFTHLIAHRIILGFCSVFVDINISMLWCWHLIGKYIQRQQLACNNVIYGLDSVVSIHSHAIHLHHTHCMYTSCLHMWLITMFVAVQPLHPISPSHPEFRDYIQASLQATCSGVKVSRHTGNAGLPLLLSLHLTLCQAWSLSQENSEVIANSVLL